MINMIFAHFENPQTPRYFYGATVDIIDYCMVYYTNGEPTKVSIDDLTRKQRNFIESAERKHNVKITWSGCIYMHTPRTATIYTIERQRLARIRVKYAKRLMRNGWTLCGSYVSCGEERLILRKGEIKR